MEDDKDLELSLGLFCHGFSNQSKSKCAPSSSEVDEGSRNRLGGGNNSNSDASLKAFFDENQDQKEKGTSNTDPQQHEHNFWNLGNKAYNDDVQTHLSQFQRYQQLWAASNNKPNNHAEQNMSNKRKISFEDANIQNKQKVVEHEDASSAIANNEDVAESEAEGSNSCIDVPKLVDKDLFASRNSNFNQESGIVEYGIPLSLKPINMTNNATDFPSTPVMQLMPVDKSECQNVQAVNLNLSSSQLSFGYSHSQLPTLETGSSWAFNCQPKYVASLQNRDVASIVENVDVDKNANEVGCSQNEVVSSRQNMTTNQPSVSLVSTIKPGIASEVKFGGSGTCPDLPWVSTTDPGPNGKTISGVTYKYSQNEVKIVCACHGLHMSPEEFVRHASADSDDQAKNANFAAFANNNPATSTKS